MIRNSIFFALFLFLSVFTKAQNQYSSKASQWQLGAFGPGSLFSVDFDSRFTNTEKGLGFRIGLGGAPLGLLGESCNRGTQFSLPAGLNYLIGKKNHFLELGVGGVLAINQSTKVYCIGFKSGFFSDETTAYSFVSAGYRFQPFHKQGLTYRVFFSPLFQNGFSPKAWGGASIGYRL